MNFHLDGFIPQVHNVTNYSYLHRQQKTKRMKNLNFAFFFKKNWIHFAAIAVFFLVTFLYFQPQFKGYALKQHDIEQFQGMAREVKMHRELYGEEPLWTNSMFGGMPTYQISTQYPGNWMTKISEGLKLWMSSPAGIFFLYLICFYISSLMLRIRPIVGVFGSFAFAFSSYFIIILQAGHNSKAAAIALAVPVIAAFIMAMRHQLKWGLLLSVLFMGIQISANHLQITYYLAIVLMFIGLGELVRAILKKELPHFMKATAGLVVMYLLAAGVNYGNLTLTNEYAKHTIRGGNDLTINPDGSSNEAEQTSGLSKDYILQWSNGIGESFTLISPYVKGGASARVKDTQFAAKLKSEAYRKNAKLISENNMYWGDQIFVSGPVYLGIVVVFLAFLSFLFAKGPFRWALLGASLLCLMLAWGSNYLPLTNFFLDYVPGYNKFRAVTIILSVLGITIPLLAVSFLHQYISDKDYIKERITRIYIGGGVFLTALLMLTFTGIGDGYLSESENDFIVNYDQQIREQILAEDPQVLLNNYGIDVTNEEQMREVIARQSADVNKQFDALVDFRKEVYRDSMLRSFLLALVVFGLVLLFLFVSAPIEAVVASFIVMVLVDLVPIDLNYLNNEQKGKNYTHWMEKERRDYPNFPTQADIGVLEREVSALPSLQNKFAELDSQKSSRVGGMSEREKWARKFSLLNFETNYRVYEPQGAFSSARASFFHKSLGGYHGAKLRRIQNLYEFHITRGNMEVLNMMNVRYILSGDQYQENPGALGNAWLVRTLIPKSSANDEILALGATVRMASKTPAIRFELNGKEHEVVEMTSNQVAELKIKYSASVDGRNGQNIDVSKAVRSGVRSSLVEDINGERNWIPSAMLEMDTTNSFTELMVVEPGDAFVARDVAIIAEGDVPSSLVYSGEGSIAMTSYKPNHMVYSVDISSGPQFAVFSEVYYPDGWKAFVQGKEVDMKRVNYLLRGLELPQGSYELEMRFEPASYRMANLLSLVLSILIVGGILFFFVKDFLWKR